MLGTRTYIDRYPNGVNGLIICHATAALLYIIIFVFVIENAHIIMCAGSVGRAKTRDAKKKPLTRARC